MKINTKQLAFIAAMALAAGAANAATQTILKTPIARLPGPFRIKVDSANKYLGIDGRIGVMVVLQGEPAAFTYQRTLASAGGRGVMAATTAGAASRELVGQLGRTQEQFVKSVNTRGIAFDELFRAQRVLNGVAMRVAPEDILRLKELPGVVKVEYLPLETPSNITSVPFINAPLVWAGANRLGLPFDAIGSGVRVGIIDTGIDYQHPDFGGTGRLVDYQRNADRTRINRIDPDDPNSANFFPTTKVVGGIDFVGDAYDGSNIPAPDPNPTDCNGHGSHVAGTVAGYGVANDGTTYASSYDPLPDYSGLRIGPGVAPGAELYALRVFGCAGATNVIVQAIEWATDPDNDGDLSDHLDVINMSLGSPEGFPSDVDAVAADNAALTGMIVVAAAGNDGDAFFVHGSPAAGRHVIAVAAVADSGLAGALLRETGPAAAEYPSSAAGYSNPPNTPAPPAISGQVGEVALVDDGSGQLSDACESAFTSDVRGKFALLDRGNCNFTDKVLNAQFNGAIGAIVVDNSDEPAPFNMGGSADIPIGIPAIGISRATGVVLRSQLALGPVSVAFVPASAGDTFASFSSRGPAGDRDGGIALKPDLAAPGVNIPSVQTGVTCSDFLSCIRPAPGGYLPGGQQLVLSGTSMAAPHVAGMMAIMRELYPDASADELKAVAMNTAAHHVTLGANGSGARFGARSVGAGRIDLALAATSRISAFNKDVDGATSITFDLEPTGSGGALHSVRLVNNSDVAQIVDLAIDRIDDAPGVNFLIAGPPTITLPAFGSSVVKIAMTTDVSGMRRVRDPTISPTQTRSLLGFDFTLPREFLSEESALLTVSSAGKALARLPLYAAMRPHSSLATAGAPVAVAVAGTTSLTLAGQDVCTGTVATTGQLSCVGDTTTDEISLVSPFELQMTGSFDPALPGFANLHYAGVNYLPDATNGDVLLFGIATYGKWGSPSVAAYNICIDTDEDGVYDKTLFNTDTGSFGPLFGLPFIPFDTYLSVVYDNTAGLAYFEAPLNLVSAAAADTAVLSNNVMMIGATVADLGLTSSTKINYGIAVCPTFDPLCTRFTLPSTQCTANDAMASFNGPYTYDIAHPGVDGSGHILLQDLDGATLAVPYDTGNLEANRSLGMLLLHHHNTSDKTAEVVVLDDLFRDGFDTQ